MDIFKRKNRRFPYEFRKVVYYMKKQRGISVVLGETTEFLGFYDRNIIIHHNYDLRKNGLYVLLYECGKTLQPATNTGVNSYKTLDKNTNFDEYRVGKILAEVDAWNRGFGLAKKLGLKIDYEKYHSVYKKELLKSYKNDK